MDSDLIMDQTVVHDGLGRVQVVVRLGGVVDLATQPKLRRALDEALAVRAVAEVVVDLEDLVLLDSTGIATLVGAYRAGAEAGVVVRVRHPRGMVQRVLEITGVLKALDGHA